MVRCKGRESVPGEFKVISSARLGYPPCNLRPALSALISLSALSSPLTLRSLSALDSPQASQEVSASARSSLISLRQPGGAHLLLTSPTVMPFPFTLPTTSHLTFQAYLASSTHPSLPSAVTTTRNSLRSALKSYKRLYPSQKASHLPHLLTILNEYIPYLLTIDAGLSGRPVCGETVDITLLQEVQVEWRPTLMSLITLPGRDKPRIQGRGLDYEIHYVLHTLSTVHHLLARSCLLNLYTLSSSSPDPAASPEARTSLIQTATKHLLTAYAIHAHLLHLTHHSADGPPPFPNEAVDILPSTQSCLAELSLAEATLLLVFKDDSYSALLRQSRDKNDREWMVKARDIPRVRAHLFARLCVGAGEHAQKAAAAGTGAAAEGGGAGKGIVKELVTYCQDLRNVARAKACRFLAVDAEAIGKTGESIAWLRGGMAELGINVSSDGGAEKMSLSRLKSSWADRRQDKKMERGKIANWGSDAGKAEEGRVLDWLERKWAKQNDTINVQIVPDYTPLVAANMPSGREAFGSHPGTWTPLMLEEDVLARMRAPFDVGEGGGFDDEQSSGEEMGGEEKARNPPVGAFPGTRGEYNSDGYY